MHLLYRSSHPGKVPGRSLDQQQVLAARFDFALPTIDGFDLWNNVDTSCQFILDQVLRDFSRLFFRSRSGQDDSLVGHMKSPVNCWLFPLARKPDRWSRLMLTQIKFGTSTIRSPSVGN